MKIEPLIVDDYHPFNLLAFMVKALRGTDAVTTSGRGMILISR